MSICFVQRALATSTVRGDRLLLGVEGNAGLVLILGLLIAVRAAEVSEGHLYIPYAKDVAGE